MRELHQMLSESMKSSGKVTKTPLGNPNLISTSRVEVGPIPCIDGKPGQTKRNVT